MTTDGNTIAPADPKLGKPKAPPPPTLTRLAGDAQVESIDGPLEIGGMVGKFLPVLTRVGDGSLGFRMMREVRQVEPAGRILRIVNAEGQSVRVGVGHVFVRADGKDVRAGDLVAGDRLEAGWTYHLNSHWDDGIKYYNLYLTFLKQREKANVFAIDDVKKKIIELLIIFHQVMFNLYILKEIEKVHY